MGSGSFFKKIQEQVLDQSSNDFNGLTKDNALEWVKKHAGETVQLLQGSDIRDKNPIDTLHDMLNKEK